MTFLKRTPLAGVLERFGVVWIDSYGWKVADNFGEVEVERRAALSGAVVADWSMLGKFEVRGKRAISDLGAVFPEVLELEMEQAYLTSDRAFLRTAPDEIWLLATPAQSEPLLAVLIEAGFGFADQTGGRGAIVIVGPERDYVLERATGLDLRERVAPVGSVRQGPVLGLTCALLRLQGADLLLVRREFTESLFEGLIDVGSGVGVRPVGLSCTSLQFEEFAIRGSQ